MPANTPHSRAYQTILRAQVSDIRAGKKYCRGTEMAGILAQLAGARYAPANVRDMELAGALVRLYAVRTRAAYYNVPQAFIDCAMRLHAAAKAD